MKNESDEHELFDDEVDDEEEEQKHVLHHNEMNEAHWMYKIFHEYMLINH